MNKRDKNRRKLAKQKLEYLDAIVHKLATPYVAPVKYIDIESELMLNMMQEMADEIDKKIIEQLLKGVK